MFPNCISYISLRIQIYKETQNCLRHCRHLEPISQKNKITWKLSPTTFPHQKNPLTLFDKQSTHFYKDISFPLAYKTKQGLISISYLPSLIVFSLIVTRFPCENKTQKFFKIVSCLNEMYASV